MKSRICSVVWGVGIALLFFSCRKDITTLSWDSNISTPIAKTSIGIKNLVTDSTVAVNEDKSLKLVYNYPVYNYLVGPVLDSTIKVAPFRQKLKLESLKLDPGVINQRYTVGEMVVDAGVQSQFPDNTSISSFLLNLLSPEFGPVTNEIDISTFFKDAVLTQGFLDYTITNKTGFLISELSLDLVNTVGGEVIFSKTITNLAPNGVSQEIGFDIAAQMAGRPVEGKITALIKKIKIKAPVGSSVVNVKYSDYLDVSIAIRDIKVSKATAIFPEQNVVEHGDVVPLVDMEDMELTSTKVKKGKVTLKVTSTIPTKLFIDFRLPNMTLNGVPYKFNSEIQAAPIGGSISIEQDFAFDNYDIDLKGKDGTGINSFYNTVTARLQPTPEPITLSLNDSLIIDIQMKDVVASYIGGYLGKDTLKEGPTTTTIALPSSFKPGTVSFDNVDLLLSIENKIGVPATLNITQLLAKNSKTGSSISASSLPATINIDKATDLGNGNVTPSIAEYRVGNATQLVNTFPDQITYALDILTNPNGNVPPHSGFTYYESTLKANLSLQVPLSVQANGLILSDTMDFLAKDVKKPEEINSGILYLIADNGLPFESNLTMYLTDSSYNVLDTLSADRSILAAEVDANGKVTHPYTTRLSYYVTSERLQHVLKARHIIVKATFDTRPTNTFLKIYEHYSLGLQLTGEFKYRLKTKL